MDNNYENIPSWKYLMAKEAAQPALKPFWDKCVKPVYQEQRKMYDQTLEQAAVEYGYKSGREYQNDVQWTKNPSPEMVEKFNAVRDKWMQLWKPYNDKAIKVGLESEEREKKLVFSYLESFDRKTKELVSEIQIIRRAGDELAIRCKMDGKQQSGETLDKNDALLLREKGISDNLLMQLAQKYFRKDIQSYMGEHQNTGMKRNF